MSRKTMVKPVEVAVSVELEKPKPRTSHGIVCSCGSDDVRVERTMDLGRYYPAFIVQHGTKVVRRYCHCQSCDKRWPQTTEVTERTIKNA